MDRSLASGEFYAACESPAIEFALVSEHSHVPSHELEANNAAIENPDGCELTGECEQTEFRPTSVDDLLAIEHWQPSEPQLCKDIAAHYQQGKRTIQKWFVDLREIAPWFVESELRLSDDRYTPLAVELLGDRYFAGSKKKWAKVLAERFADRVATVAAAASSAPGEIPVSPTEVMPPAPGDRPTLPPVDRTAASSLVPTGSSYLSALKEEELELEQLETQELELLGRMHGNLERLTQNQTQWQRTNDLRRQRLLRQTRLEAAALATELEAEFDETLRESQYNIRRGNVGKPITATPPS
jgi:hypothetical protein